MTGLALPSGLPPGAYWRHEDPRGIAEGAARALARAEKADWSSGSSAARASDFRDWLVLRSWIAARFAGSAGTGGEGQMLVIFADYQAAAAIGPTNPRARAVRAIGRTQAILARQIPGFVGWAPPRVFATGPDGETGFPLVAIAIVTVIVAVAESAAVAYLAHQASQVVDNYLARRADLSGLVQADAAVLRVLDKHAERETAEGRALPLDPAETAALAELERRQVALAALKTPPVVGADDGGLPWWALPVGIAAAVAAVSVFSR
jgi:hypothetical protein